MGVRVPPWAPAFAFSPCTAAWARRPDYADQPRVRHRTLGLPALARRVAVVQFAGGNRGLRHRRPPLCRHRRRPPRQSMERGLFRHRRRIAVPSFRGPRRRACNRGGTAHGARSRFFESGAQASKGESEREGFYVCCPHPPPSLARAHGGVLDSTLGWSALLPVESRGPLVNPPAKPQTAKLKKCPWLPNDSHVGLATPASWN